MNIVFSEPELAIKSGLAYFHEEEENVYVCPIKYPSGVEYHLKKANDIVSDENCLKKFELTDMFRFQRKDKAMKAIGYFRKKGKRYQFKKKTEEENGYKFVKYFYLCLT